MSEAIQNAIYNILTPFVRILFRKGVAFGEFRQLLKRVYVDVAAEELVAAGGKPTLARIAVVTGLTRKDVAQLRKEKAIEHKPSGKHNRLTRVLTGWQSDSDFSDEDGALALPRSGGSNSFDALVERYSGDMHSRAILDELIRLGSAGIQEDGSIVPLADSYLAGEDEDEYYNMMGIDVSHLLSGIHHNLQSTVDDRWYQRKVMYNNLPEDCLDEFRQLANKENQKLLLKLNKWLAIHDRDTNPDIKGSGKATAAVGIYYFEDRPDKEA